MAKGEIRYPNTTTVNVKKKKILSFQKSGNKYIDYKDKNS